MTVPIRIYKTHKTMIIAITLSILAAMATSAYKLWKKYYEAQ